MRRLSDQERVALVEVGPPDEGPISEETFEECIRMGWGFWGDDGFWYVTPLGVQARKLDDEARK